MLCYTFRTNKLIINQFGSDQIFVFDKLKKDYDEFTKIILEKKPDYIVGMAINNNLKQSQFEKIVLNKFNNKKVSKYNLKNSYELNVFDELNFIVNKKGTTSFCNWTAFKIQEFIEEKKLKTKQIFLHLKTEDVNKLFNFLNQ